ncbi:MAG: hypothetical protein ACLUE4_09835 [Acutalibacteraceae bacterium]
MRIDLRETRPQAPDVGRQAPRLNVRRDAREWAAKNKGVKALQQAIFEMPSARRAVAQASAGGAQNILKNSSFPTQPFLFGSRL